MSTPWVVLTVVLAVIVSVPGGWLLTAGVLRLADRSSAGDRGDSDGGGTRTTEDAGAGAPERSDGPDGRAARAALRGGTWIGILERLAVTGCILAGEPGGVAVVVAIKGLGRYPELKANPGASERFVIGTLASLLWSAAVGTLGRALILG